jgi:hypothetical protein
MSLQIQSFPPSFQTVHEFHSPSSFPSWSEFEGFSDNDDSSPQSPSHCSNADLAAASFAPSPTCNPDGSLRTLGSLEDAPIILPKLGRGSQRCSTEMLKKSKGKREDCIQSIQEKITTTRSKGRGSATRAEKVRARPGSSEKESRALIGRIGKCI